MTRSRRRALVAAAAAIRSRRDEILTANARDMEGAQARKLSGALLDRLLLDPKRVEAMAKGLEEVAALPDPIDDVIAEWTRPNGLCIQRVRVPLGVIGIIYESRPNVTADAGALCLKSGNAVILRGGSESFHSTRQSTRAVAGLRRRPAGNALRCADTSRDAVATSRELHNTWLIVPRCGKTCRPVRLTRGCRSWPPRIWPRHLPAIPDSSGPGHPVHAEMRRTGFRRGRDPALDRNFLTTHWGPIADSWRPRCELRGLRSSAVWMGA